ncbi:hypothetical protein [Micromonospora sp. NPDC003816]|uniref:hypothetical protein n=1 Tax=Micromonospora sp. NPDC003816 TaxID=3364224 RepID=UPI0036B0AC81
MTPAPNDKQVARGTWGGRQARRRRAPDHTSYDFSPVDKRPPGSAASDAVDAQLQFEADRRSGLHPALVMAKQAARLVEGRRRERARQQQTPQWSVDPVRESARRFLNEVARYCFDQGRWGSDTEVELIAVSEDFTDPIRRMGQTRDRMGQLGSRVRQSTAVEVGSEVQHAAQTIANLVKTHFRAVPPQADLPVVELRLTNQQRRAALIAIGKESDRHLESWYAFVCSSPPPGDTGTRLRHIVELLPVMAEVERWRAGRERCGTLVATDDTTRATVVPATQELKAAITAFEEAVYRACVRSGPAD